MYEKQLLETEQILYQSDNKLITLTNLRLRYDDSGTEKFEFASIMLEKISSIEVKYESKFKFLMLGIICLIIDFILYVYVSNFPKGLFFFGLLCSATFIIYFFFTRKHFVLISSDGGGEIAFNVQGNKKFKLLEFINLVEQAKHNISFPLKN